MENVQIDDQETNNVFRYHFIFLMSWYQTVIRTYLLGNSNNTI